MRKIGRIQIMRKKSVYKFLPDDIIIQIPYSISSDAEDLFVQTVMDIGKAEELSKYLQKLIEQAKKDVEKRD